MVLDHHGSEEAGNGLEIIEVPARQVLVDAQSLAAQDLDAMRSAFDGLL